MSDFRILPENRAAIARAYNWHHSTLRRKLKEIGITHRCALTPIELELIYTKFGHPGLKRELARKFGE